MELLRAALAAHLGSAVESARPVSGGDANRAFLVTLEDGRRVFAKTPPRGASVALDFYAREAEGLAWLGEADRLRVPEVLGVGDLHAAAPWLALERVEPGPRGADFATTLGRRLAALHAAGAPHFGLAADNFIGPLLQRNASRADWPSFYSEQRIAPQLRAARDAGRIDASVARAGERVLAGRMHELCGPPEPPARLHGDLWAGNLMCDERGEPVLVDPAVYGGHREVDLAMMRLFGGFDPATFAAYEQAHPLSPGAPDRIELYQLYPLLVHVNLFGGGYAQSIAQVLTRYA